jgi:hypothetical protein
MKTFSKSILFTLIAVVMSVQAASCTAPPSTSVIQTAIAGTQAAAPVQIVQVTQVVQVTRLVSVRISETPTKPGEATATREATPLPSITPSQTETPLSSPQSTLTPTPVQTATIKPGTPLGLSLSYFIHSYMAMTDLQKKEYLPTLPGRTVSWTGSVSNVTADGLVLLKFPEPLVGTITLLDVPKATALKVNRNYLVDFTGVIQEFREDLNLRLVISNTKISAIYLPPTLTPTEAPRWGR